MVSLFLNMRAQKVRKVIIPVAGFGTRFLPVTKAMPKEMLPIIDKPVIQYIVEEAVASGIKDVILVTSHTKRPVEDHFDDNFELEAWLKKKGKIKELRDIKRITQLANFIYVRQKGPYGNATPVLNARDIIGDEPFAVIWGDDIFNCKRPRLRQMLDVYEEYGKPVIAALKTDAAGTKKYGIVDKGKRICKGVYEVKSVVEKPGPEKAPSRLASIGGYVLPPDVFTYVEKLKPGHGGEVILLDAINAMMKKTGLVAVEIEGEYFDTGSRSEWLRANISFALQRKDLAKDVKRMLKSMK